MFIYSGKVRMGECGATTGKKDLHGKDLFVGDIVAVWSVSKDDEYGEMLTMFHNMSAVVHDEYGDHYEVADREPTPFVMGIRRVEFENDDDGDFWRVFKMKDHSDAIDGEHWKNYGFRYSET